MGIPKICVSFTPCDIASVDQLIEPLVVNKDAFDIIEWRADYFQDDIASNMNKLGKTLQELEKPLIFTFRTLMEGGKKEILPEQYEAYCLLAAQSSFFDYVDVELQMLQPDLIDKLHQAQAKVIISHHNFTETPSSEEMIQILKQEELQGADIVKLAVMPSTKEDVACVVATAIAFHKTSDTDMIVIAMGDHGKPTRVMGETLGNCITFGSIGKNSAPGQINVRVLKEMMEAIHQRL